MIRADVKSFSWGYVVGVSHVAVGTTKATAADITPLVQCRYSKNDINGPVDAMRDCLRGLLAFVDDLEQEP
jgi:hypothetical protein